MATTTSEDLKKAYRKEKDPRVIKRMAAVNMVCMNDESIWHAADLLMRCPGRASFRAERFRGEASMPSGILPGAAGGSSGHMAGSAGRRYCGTSGSLRDVSERLPQSRTTHRGTGQG